MTSWRLLPDEPTTGLDPQSGRSLWRLVEEYRATGGTVLLTTHYVEEPSSAGDDERAPAGSGA